MKDFYKIISLLEEKLKQDMIDKNSALNLLDKLKSQLQSVEAKNDELLRKQDFYLGAFNSLPNPIFIKDASAKFIFFNDAYKKYFAIKNNKYIGKSVLDLEYIPEKDRSKYHKEDLMLIDTGSVMHYKKNFESPTGEETTTLYWSCGFESAANQKGIIGEIVDISAEAMHKERLQNTIAKLKASNSKIKEIVKHDHLTTLYNRRALNVFVENISDMRKKFSCSVCVLLLDLDKFKRVNDTWGHTYGDQVLVEFSNILKDCCRNNDIIIRYGGEEFMIMLINIRIKAATNIAKRICKETETKIGLPDESKMTTSIGVVEYYESESFEECIKRVDRALYSAKDNGRNQVVAIEK